MAAFEVIALDTATPQLRAPGASDTYTFPRAVEMPLGTANGVLYLNGSKVVTSGSALTFDGSTLVNGVGSTWTIGAFRSSGSGVVGIFGANQFASSVVGIGSDSNHPLTFNVNSTEQMRLDSTGLGIGTSSPTVRLQLEQAANSAPVTLLRLNNSGTTGGGPGIASRISFTAGATALGYVQGINFASGAAGLQFSGDGTNAQATLDASGNLGLGVTPSGWGTFTAAQIGATASLAAFAGQTVVGSNWYYNSGDKYLTTDYASVYSQSLGQHRWYTAPSGTAGNAISFTQALTLDANRNLLLNGTTAGASAVGTLAIFNGTAPTGSVTDGIILYAEDVSSSSELKVRDEAGNVTTLSPHNFSLIPEGPSEDMAWAYYSEKGGKRINVDMLKLARMVEKLTGEKLVYES